MNLIYQRFFFHMNEKSCIQNVIYAKFTRVQFLDYILMTATSVYLQNKVPQFQPMPVSFIQEICKCRVPTAMSHSVCVLYDVYRSQPSSVSFRNNSTYKTKKNRRIYFLFTNVLRLMSAVFTRSQFEHFQIERMLSHRRQMNIFFLIYSKQSHSIPTYMCVCAGLLYANGQVLFHFVVIADSTASAL